MIEVKTRVTLPTLNGLATHVDISLILYTHGPKLQSSRSIFASFTSSYPGTLSNRALRPDAGDTVCGTRVEAIRTVDQYLHHSLRTNSSNRALRRDAGEIWSNVNSREYGYQYNYMSIETKRKMIWAYLSRIRANHCIQCAISDSSRD